MTFNPDASPFRLRIGVENLGDASSGNFQIYAKKNSGSYAAITTSSTGGVQSYDASSDADDTIIRVPRLSLDWRLSGAAIDLDFAGDRIYPNGAAFTDYLSCSRASDGYAQNSNGDWVQFSSNALRITDLGLLIEDARTNYLLNSGTPVTQETGSLDTGNYTLWVEGSGSAIASNGTGTITGAESATEGSPSIFTVTVAGTLNVTVTGSLDRFQLEGGNFSSSYISTGGATAARAADLVTCTGDLGSILLAATASCIFKSGIVLTNRADNAIALFSRGTGSIFRTGDSGSDGGHNHATTYNGGSDLICTLGSGTWTGSLTNKMGCSWDGNGRSIVANNGTVAADANGPGTATSAILTSPYFTDYPFAYYKRITAWNSRLADATLGNLTAL